jgi:mRNA-degrading endonuclease toxin of MazEF toxin-antitoxin module
MSDERPERGEVWLAEIIMPSAKPEPKPRPVLVVQAVDMAETAETIVIVPITSQVFRPLAFDIPLTGNMRAKGQMGLRRDSLICCGMPAVLSFARFRRRIGEAPKKTMMQVDDRLRALLFPSAD